MGPDRKVHTFPLGTPPAKIDAQMRKIYGGKSGVLLGGRSVRPESLVALADDAYLRQKLQRYEEFIQSELARNVIVDSGDGFGPLMEMTLIENRAGKESIAAQSAFSGPKFDSCLIGCKSQWRCLVDCVDKYDIRAAKTLACQLLPDDLPY